MIAQHSSNTNEHPTPSDVVERSRRVMGGIDLDPASCARFNERIRAERFYGRRENGLVKPWSGRVFLNPPGGLVRFKNGLWRPVPKNENGRYKGPGESSMRIWWDRLTNLWLGGLVEQAIFVAFTLEILRTSQEGNFPVQRGIRCYPKERLRFGGDAPTHANVLVYLPPKGDELAFRRFRSEFASVGFCEEGSRQ